MGRMLTAVDDDFQVELSWDSVGNLLQDRQGYTAVGSERWQAVNTAYTDAGSMSAIAYPSTFQVSHTRDVIYRMTAMVDASGPTNIATFTWQGASRLATTSNQNGTGTDYVYDGFRNIASIDHTLSGGGSLHKFEYAYDKVHNRRMEKNTFSTTWITTLPAAVQTFLGGRNGKGDVYAYDMAYRLVDARYDVTNPLTEVQNPGTQAFVTNIAYTIDGLGNRSQVATTPPTPPTQVLYANDVVNQYTTVGGQARSHDNNGNLSDDGTYKFGYDFENRLVELRNSTTSALIASYRYDALGRRVEKSVVGGATTRYVLDGVQVVEEFDGSNVWQARYVYEDGIDQPRCMDRADIADVNGNSNTTEVLRFHYHQQALGSVTELTQPSGAVVEWVTYDVYGLPTIRNQVGTTVTQSAVGNPWLYTGREYDPESGLYFYRARTYDPGTGRFLQRDPLGYVDGLSAHEYVSSTPARLTDPHGLRGELKEAERDLNLAKRDLLKGMLKFNQAMMNVVSLQNQMSQLHIDFWAALSRWLEWRKYRHCVGAGVAKAFMDKLADLLSQIEALQGALDTAVAEANAIGEELKILVGAFKAAAEAYLAVLQRDLADDTGQLRRIQDILDNWTDYVINDIQRALDGKTHYAIGDGAVGKAGADVVGKGTDLAIGVGLGLAGKALQALQGTVTVTRWGRSLLHSGDWVVVGGKSPWNYLLSFKWIGKNPAGYGSGSTYQVVRSKLKSAGNFLHDLLGHRRIK
jgi:RHS repeat-associated protein